MVKQSNTDVSNLRLTEYNQSNIKLIKMCLNVHCGLHPKSRSRRVHYLSIIVKPAISLLKKMSGYLNNYGGNHVKKTICIF